MPGIARTAAARRGPSSSTVAREAFLLVAGVEVAAQRAHRDPVGARCAAEAEVDAPRVQRGQGAELLGDDQRSVVGQHHAARADADGLRAAGDVAD
jgi:hypothetical protein